MLKKSRIISVFIAIFLLFSVVLCPQVAFAAEGATPRYVENVLYVNGTTVNIRSGPGTNYYAITTTTASGELFEYIETSADGLWYKIKLGDSYTNVNANGILGSTVNSPVYGWISKTYAVIPLVSYNSIKTGYANVSTNLNLRHTPSTSYQVIRRILYDTSTNKYKTLSGASYMVPIPDNTQLSVYGKLSSADSNGNVWYLVKYNGRWGWVVGYVEGGEVYITSTASGSSILSVSNCTVIYNGNRLWE